MRRDPVRRAFRMVADGEIQTALPKKAPIRCIIDPKGKFRETPRAYAKATGKYPCARVAGRGTVILDVKFVGIRRKDFSGMGIIGLDGDKRRVIVLKAESGCHDGSRCWSSWSLACQSDEGEDEDCQTHAA
jgi:hypothetical protein